MHSCLSNILDPMGKKVKHSVTVIKCDSSLIFCQLFALRNAAFEGMFSRFVNLSNNKLDLESTYTGMDLEIASTDIALYSQRGVQVSFGHPV